ncbi:MAG: hypothetical protein ABR563_02675 [Pyrinomonadaceae bacterium]
MSRPAEISARPSPAPAPCAEAIPCAARAAVRLTQEPRGIGGAAR